MTLVLNATTAEGIVIAADSRQSYRNQKGMARIGSDNASKLFQINRRIEKYKNLKIVILIFEAPESKI